MLEQEKILSGLNRKPFPWQFEQATVFHEKLNATAGSGNYTLVAAMNSGKTDAAGMNMLVAMSCFNIKLLVFVSPSGLIKDQIIDDFAFMGLNFSAEITNRRLLQTRLDPVLDGMSCTYQQVARSPQLFRKLTSQEPTMVVMDEVHHLASELSWGDACKEAFEHSQIRMVMSGTPFRCDGNAIPFVNYEQEV